MQQYHTAVLLNPAIDGLAVRPQGIYVDATFGGGGHARAILELLGPGGRLIAFDQDQDVQQHIPQDERFTLVPANFMYIHNFLNELGISAVDGILADLGVSSHHFDAPARGFSFRKDGALDMRMDKNASQTAAQLINQAPAEQLAQIFEDYGEIKAPHNIVAHIMAQRPLHTTRQLADALRSFPQGKVGNKLIVKIFQALRIEVNHELDALKRLLRHAPAVLKPGGRMAVISFHSLEDRLVKQFFKSGHFGAQPQHPVWGSSQPPMRPVNKKVILPTQEEIKNNPRASSAKLRIAQRQKPATHDS